MTIQIYPLQSALSEIFVHATEKGVLTLADRYGLMAILLHESLSDEEHDSLDRLLRAVRKGQVQMVSELSLVLDTTSAPAIKQNTSDNMASECSLSP